MQGSAPSVPGRQAVGNINLKLQDSSVGLVTGVSAFWIVFKVNYFGISTYMLPFQTASAYALWTL